MGRRGKEKVDFDMNDVLDTRYEGAQVELKTNRVALGDDVNLMAADPALKDLVIAVGWDTKGFGGEAVDVDVSLFLLNSTDMTRVNEDFIYYNNMSACEGAVRHEGDNRTGAGGGDDETILVNLHGVPFDISRLVFVYSIYKGAEKDQDLSMVKNAYIRVINASNDHEILRFNLDEHFAGVNDTAAIVGSINREGPKWHFTPLMEFEASGLGAIAKKYGMNIISQ